MVFGSSYRVFVMGGGVVILSQVRDNGSCSGCVFQANNPTSNAFKQVIEGRIPLREGFRFILLGITHKIVCDSFCLIHFSFRHIGFALLLERS